VSDVADLRRQVVCHEVDVISQILPGSGDALHFSLAAEFAFRTDLASDAGDFASERVQLVDHRINRVLQLKNFNFDLDRNFLGKVPAGDGCCLVSDVADLRSQVRGHEVDVVG